MKSPVLYIPITFYQKYIDNHEEFFLDEFKYIYSETMNVPEILNFKSKNEVILNKSSENWNIRFFCKICLVGRVKCSGFVHFKGKYREITSKEISIIC